MGFGNKLLSSWSAARCGRAAPEFQGGPIKLGARLGLDADVEIGALAIRRRFAHHIHQRPLSILGCGLLAVEVESLLQYVLAVIGRDAELRHRRSSAA